jgi:sugar lactone lactonase YvrE
MRRYLTLVLLLGLSIPAGVVISGCTRNPAGNYCNGLGYGLKDTELYAITLQPQTTGISLAFGQTKQIATPTAKTCKNAAATVSSYTYGTTNNKLVDLSPGGNICAGTWNRNSGGGIADYTICSPPNPQPTSDGLPYSVAYVTASAQSVTSNPVAVYIHAQVSSITLALAGQQQCYSQGAVAQLDAEACYSGGSNQQFEFCAPPTVTHYSCPGGLAQGVTSVPECAAAIGVLSYAVGTSTVATINSVTNQITAEQPGTTVITASVANSGSSAGYFSTCPPKTIQVTLTNGGTEGTITQGVQQNLVTTVTDTAGQTITGVSLDYQSTNPLDVSVASTGGLTAAFPGTASISAICQPTTCNPSPINEVGLLNTGLSISSNPVTVTVPGTASSYVWLAAPGKSQYFTAVELLTGTTGSTIRLPYVPNSMVMDQTGTNLYFGSSHELMMYTTTNNSLSKEDTTVPGVVLAVSPNNRTVVINDQVRKLFYLYNSTGTIASTFGGVGAAAAWTPDSKTLYITDSASQGAGHSDTLYVYNASTGWTTYDLSSSGGASNLAVTIPGVGAYLSGNPTVAHTWCPTGTIGNYATMHFYPQGDQVPVQTDTLAATTDGQHILGAAFAGGGITLHDIAVTVPNGACPTAVSNALQPLLITHTLNDPVAVNVNATAVDQVVTSPAAVRTGSSVPSYSLAFITYTGTSTGATLPYYIPAASGAGKLGYVTLTGASAITAPVAGAFSPDNTLFFVSTSGDNQVHYINTTSLTDTQQISPNLPACTPGSDPGCTLAAPSNNPVPATAIAVKPRSTT